MAATFPRTDRGLLSWLQNFYAVANPIATSLGLTTSALTAFNLLVTSYQTCLAACDPGVRNKAAVAAKNTARTNVKNSARFLTTIVEGQSTVSDSQKLELGINVRKSPAPAPAPTTAPTIGIPSVSGFTAKIRLSTPGKKRGKPNFVIGASFFSFIGEAPPTDLSQWKFEGNSGKPVFEVQFPNTLAKGTTVWFTSFWFNGAKLSGPMAAPISTVIQGGTVTMTEKKTA